MDQNYYEAVTLHQEAEALECAIAILERWSALDTLTEPLRKEHKRIVHKADKMRVTGD